MKKISIAGTEGAGKSVFITALAQSMDAVESVPYLLPESSSAAYYTAGIWDELQRGQWPKSTDTGVIKDLKWTWKDTAQNEHQLQMLDCAGQDFRAIFETESDGGLTERQRALKKEFFTSNLVIVLLNLQRVLDIYDLPAKKMQKMKIEFAPASALRRLNKAGIKTFLCFTQCDRYVEVVNSRFDGKPKPNAAALPAEVEKIKTRQQQAGRNDPFIRATAACLPILFNAMQNTETPLYKVSAVETEYRADPGNNGAVTLLPRNNCAPGNLREMITAIDDFLVLQEPVFLPPPLPTTMPVAHSGNPQKKPDFFERVEARDKKPSTWFFARGRASRGQFNWFHLGSLSFVYLCANQFLSAPVSFVPLEYIIFMVLLVGLLMGLFFVQVSFLIRRFHDLDRSGWNVFLLFIPILNFFIFLGLMIKPGTEGSNKYGANPRRS
jgi:uncharacterized membrane protein YhaH (DUF805 family)